MSAAHRRPPRRLRRFRPLAATLAPNRGRFPTRGEDDIDTDQSTGRKRQPLSARRLGALRKLLEAERGELLSQITRLDADFLDESWREPRSDDDAETGSATFERERTMSLARNARRMLAEIDQALERMDDGRYGLCTSCGKPISHERLEALPQAQQCLDCRREAERASR